MVPDTQSTDHRIQEVYDLLKAYRPTKKKETQKLNTVINELVKDKIAYQMNVDTLYYERSFIKKILYFFGFFISPQEKKQLACIRKISQTVDFAESKKSNFTESYDSRMKKEAKAQLHKQYSDMAASKDFRDLLAFSLKDDPSDQEIKKAKSTLQGANFYVSDLYFEKIISDFLTSSKFNTQDKIKVTDLLKAFQFNQNVVWKSAKYQGFSVNQTSYIEKATARLHKSLAKMKPGDEVVFSGTTSVQGETTGHAVLFSCKMLNADTFCVRLYDTSDPAAMIASVTGVLQTGWSWIRGHDAEIATRRNFKIEVNQAFFHKKELTSKEFSEIFTQEILIFQGIKEQTTPEIFARYKQFATKNQINPTAITNAPKAPQIKFQQGPTCAIASKLAYIEETLGPGLYNRFKDFVRK